jgi:hypothetical protein
MYVFYIYIRYMYDIYDICMIYISIYMCVIHVLDIYICIYISWMLNMTVQFSRAPHLTTS